MMWNFWMNKFQKPISKYLIWVIWPFPISFWNTQERKVACETIVGFHGYHKSRTDPPEWHHLQSIDLELYSHHNLLLFETVQDPLLMTHNLINHLVLNSKRLTNNNAKVHKWEILNHWTTTIHKDQRFLRFTFVLF